jgi:hypothetical protein
MGSVEPGMLVGGLVGQQEEADEGSNAAAGTGAPRDPLTQLG